ncbi:unnamed protein product [Heligmosomoides polygyrus]|uniref:Uncharacterized protein n=1 Tax=Heligmosomoides polygyrus TaxID=6339 RepID=A0A183G429_HELPZ|nr:unnamed protein product [Heligmosomoides polygyrus]
MSFSPAKVVSILLAEFGVPDDNDAPTREEKKIARRFAAILRDGAAASIDVETDEILGSDVSTDDESDWDHCYDEGEENSSTTHQNVIHFDTTAVTVTKDIQHYRSSSKGYRSLSSMGARCRWIRNDDHLRKLRRIENEQQEALETKARRSLQMKRIAALLHEEMREKMAAGWIPLLIDLLVSFSEL